MSSPNVGPGEDEHCKNVTQAHCSENSTDSGNVIELFGEQFTPFDRTCEESFDAALSKPDTEVLKRKCSDYLQGRLNYTENVDAKDTAAWFESQHREVEWWSKVFNFSLSTDSSREVVRIDAATLRNIDFDAFFLKAFDFPLNSLTRAVVRDALQNPPKDIIVCQAKQDAVKELATSPEKFHALANAVELVDRFEKFSEQIARFYAGWIGSEFLAEVSETLRDLVRMAQELPDFESPYLSLLKDQVLQFAESTVFQYAELGIAKTLAGITPFDAEHVSTTHRKYWPYTVSNRTKIGMLCAGGLTAISSFIGGIATFFSQPRLSDKFYAGSLFSLFGMAGIAAALYLKEKADKKSVVTPVVRQMRNEQSLKSALYATARILEIASYAKLLESEHQSCWPVISRGNNHHFVVEGMICPSARNNRNFVANNLCIDKNGVVLLTGPNSAGKTRTAKSAVFTQILAQNGSPVTCHEARIGVADVIGYQLRIEQTIEDAGGDLEMSLQEAAPMILGATPYHFQFFDEPAKGTSSIESDELTRDRMAIPLVLVGSSAVFITHKSTLAQELQEAKQKGISFLQMEVIDEEPTRQVIAGVATSSLAKKVANKAGLSESAIKDKLRQFAAYRQVESNKDSLH